MDRQQRPGRRRRPRMESMNNKPNQILNSFIKGDNGGHDGLINPRVVPIHRAAAQTKDAERSRCETNLPFLSIVTHFLMLPFLPPSVFHLKSIFLCSFSIFVITPVSFTQQSYCRGLFVPPPPPPGDDLPASIPLPVTDFILLVSIFLTSSGHIASAMGRKGQSANAQSDSRYIT